MADEDSFNRRIADVLREPRETLDVEIKGWLDIVHENSHRATLAKARARGYGTDRHLIAMSYLICANLKHLPKNPLDTCCSADCGVKVNHTDRERASCFKELKRESWNTVGSRRGSPVFMWE
ncbi:hypothetical protein ACO2Q2_04040 [Dyella sp. KRB-257]|uniref:hypothetical protein n=1 Tax=Dyella sp. KRB-257 TaxID=3400915 RepID=UPI003C0C6938